MLSARVHQRTAQRVRDVAFDGPAEVVWIKKRCSGVALDIADAI